MTRRHIVFLSALAALAVFAAAGLAKADMWQSGAQAMRIGAAVLIVCGLVLMKLSSS